MGTFSKIVVSTCCLLIRALQYSYIVKGHCCPHYIGSFSGTSSALFVCLFDAGVVWVAFSCIYTVVTLWHVINEHKKWQQVWMTRGEWWHKELLSEKTNSGEKQKVGWMRRICEESQCWEIGVIFFGRLNFFWPRSFVESSYPFAL